MKEKIILTLTVIVLAAALIGLGVWRHPVYAAPAQEVQQCEKVAETPNLAIYLCEPDNGPPFYINSYGFMMVLE